MELVNLQIKYLTVTNLRVRMLIRSLQPEKKKLFGLLNMLILTLKIRVENSDRASWSSVQYDTSN